MTLAYQRPKRFAKWVRLCGPRTGGLAEQVEAVFLQRFLDAGYAPVTLECGDRGRAVSGLEIRLEKAEQGLFKSVTIQFDKYRDPRFQVAVERERAGEQRPFDQANLVPRKGKYYHFWGKPWLAPNRFWSAKASARLARRLAGLFPQCEAFLESGVRGRNLSRPIILPVFGAPASPDPV
ncbi:hypothetical protein DMC25_25200 [Caulobacter sp. D4A]|uniref:hypothetical protein n=1 Tax=unclassified Caulobacter TaxID=2648921 RepID=UPI000D73A194|nr:MULTISPECIES: hypothetical protein [unclassified Caulobacter]PXA75026.1 hypothetical protein DMC25_25200 [Caulobacter sp. D4A]PXA93393.1 hypothetical protein DMC18_08935 [Caulobacter sp. D5]